MHWKLDRDVTWPVTLLRPYLGPGQQLGDEPDGLQVALSQQQPPLLHGDLHLQLLLLLLLLPPQLLQVLPLLPLSQLQLSLPQPLFLLPLLLLLLQGLLSPEGEGNCLGDDGATKFSPSKVFQKTNTLNTKEGKKLHTYLNVVLNILDTTVSLIREIFNVF